MSDSRSKPLKSVFSTTDEEGNSQVVVDFSTDEESGELSYHNDLPPTSNDEYSGYTKINIIDKPESCACTGMCLCNGIKQTFSSGAAFLTAIPPAMNAFANAMDVHPADSFAAFLTKDLAIQIFSTVNGVSSLTINTIMNAYYLPTALGRFLDNIMHSFDSPSAFFSNLTTMLFGFGGAIATSAISYEAFQWLPGATFSATIPTAMGFAMFVATRYVGVLNVFNRAYNLLNPDTQTQTQFGDEISRIKKDKLDNVRDNFFAVLDDLLKVELKSDKDEDVNKAFTSEEMDLIADRLATVLNEIAALDPNLVEEKEMSNAAYAAKYAGLIFDITFAIACGLPAYLTFMQKGFDGISVISKFAGYDFSRINPWLKPIAGVIPGLASGMLYFDSGSKFRGVLVELAQYIWESPKRILVAAPLLVANYLAAYGPENIAAGILKNKFNIIGMYNNTTLGSIFAKLNFVGGLAVNGGSSINKVMTFFAEPEKPLTRENILSRKDDVLNVVSKHLQTNFDNISKPESEARLHKFGVFSKTIAEKKNPAQLVVNEEPSHDTIISFS